MRKGLLIWILTVLCFGCACNSFGQSTEKMNVIFFLVDDLGWSDVACNNPNSFYETPQIDALAKQGVRFTNAYAACHVCSPTRASILTGKYPARINLTDWLPGRKDYPFQKLKNVEINQQLPLEEKTLAETFRENGYHTAIFGKWHLGDSSSPLKHGFDYRVTEWNKGWPLTYYSPFKLKGLEGPEGEYLTDRLTNEALKYIENNKDAPFFLYLAHFAVHDPIQGRADLVKKYQDKLKSMPPSEIPSYILEANPDTARQLSRTELDALLNKEEYEGFSLLPNRTVKIRQRQDNVQFAAMVESMDESLGRVIDKLKELDLEKRTIIVFVSDNGGMSAANFARPAKTFTAAQADKEFSTSNLPLRGAKGWFYEGGIRVPMIIKWPGHGNAGAISDIPVISTDLYPSLLNMAGLAQQPQQHLDGVDISPLIEGKKKLKRKALYWHFPHYSNHGMQSPGGAIRYGRYKLLEYFENGTVQLFNLETDPGEEHDLAATMPRKAAQLKEMLHAWRKEVNAKMMPLNPNYKP